LDRVVEPTDPDRLGEDADETERIYSEQWHAALEHLLASQGVFDTAGIDARATAFAAGDRPAEEFVRGERGHLMGGLHRRRYSSVSSLNLTARSAR
jgi:hypothetical protein